MIHVVYQEGWDVDFSQISELNFCSSLLQVHSSVDQEQSLSSLIKSLIDRALLSFDEDKSLKGFLAFSDSESNTLTPFSVTSHYCIKVIRCSLRGEVQMIVSPIYHLGLDYPEVYQHREGKALDPNAMLGLVEIIHHAESMDDEPVNESCDGHMYCYGIDAGVAFKNSPVAHNRDINLQLLTFDDCVLATFQSNGQVSTQSLPLDEVLLNDSQLCFSKFSDHSLAFSHAIVKAAH
ncbi:MAG: hypothetical protein CL816_02445 [Coxiellaceae bacterium]|nr:hypothetical protein [Coxiellaceae bacterium]